MGCFVLAAKAPGANINFLLLPTHNNCNPMNIGQPFPLSTFLRVAYTVTKLSPFTTNIALHRKNSFNPFTINDT